MTNLTVIGGGLAGSEAAWQAAEHGLSVELYEMRPAVSTGAHVTDYLAELVCSNSLGSNLPDRASGVLKNEIRRLGSMLLECAERAAVPAGAALAVDRLLFARLVSERIEGHSRIRVIRKELASMPDGLAIIASGPLTSASLAASIAQLTGRENLYFFDAVSPIVAFETVDMTVAFRASRRREPGDADDYLNCPLSRDEYYAFVDALINAERIGLRSFEAAIAGGINAGRFFEGCLPVEVIAQRGRDSLAFGPLRPVGLRDPRTGSRPYAVVQLRQDNLAGDLYNLVGFQTNLKYPEQKRVFRLIPGLENAEFHRFGHMHRNTFIASPEALLPTLQFVGRPDLLFAGQLTGIEGYLGNIASGLLAGINAANLHSGLAPMTLPATTMLGALCHYVSHADLRNFQPMKANFGILPPLDSVDSAGHAGKRGRAQAFAERAMRDLERFLTGMPAPAP
jgi:methylenetetrahydrofolate--tRNA-(uracil-5-)-methyltransferase